MPWRWDSPQADDAVAVTTGLAQEFPTQADAEAWLTQNYEELEDAGLDEVTLLQDGRVVYGPMSLHA
ncbi:hypothetical protein G7070_12325 [Propioniciclava coleopterorum]|uniref:Uncharacterized protein n=1 Tax=Propioniciclava coleopterorum TaxID=2714937 RepID=A0A6G7Y8A1_9ACTN|nr:hypothetical protein [Propioniciclava coleopterorum]QIK72906.1 hypothetical protein G7070_12325 [Propioniciclava coleopterorum]